MAIEAWAILPDIHIPYHSKKALSLVSQVLEAERKMEGIIQLGDLLELESVSRWPRGRGAHHYLKDEVKEAKAYFYEFRKRHRFLKFNYIFGNHEDRLNKYLVNNAPVLEDIGPTIPEIFDFRYWTINHVPYTHNQLVRFKNTDQFFRHEPISGGKMPVKATAEVGGVNLMFGHTHTCQKYTHKNLLGKYITARALGWLGDASKACFNYRGPRDTWSLDFTMIYYNTDTSHYYIQDFDLNQQELFYNGKIIKP